MDWMCPPECFEAKTAADWQRICISLWFCEPLEVEQSPLRGTIVDLLADAPGTRERLLNRTSASEQNMATVLSTLCLVAHSLDNGLIVNNLEGALHVSTRRALLHWYQCFRSLGVDVEYEEAAMLMEAYNFANMHLLVR
jgi:hypothetical protein